MKTYVPIISSSTPTPDILGVLHLKRLWLKLLLAAFGALRAGYDACGHGFDQMTLTALNLDRDAVMKYIQEKKPTYQQFVSWVKTEPGVKLDQNVINELNASIREYKHTEITRADILVLCGLDPADPNQPWDAVTLNDMEDAEELRRLLEEESTLHAGYPGLVAQQHLQAVVGDALVPSPSGEDNTIIMEKPQAEKELELAGAPA